MDIGTLATNLPAYREMLSGARSEVEENIAWYPYDILGNLQHLDALLNGEHRDLNRLADGLPVADIGGADGDLAFVLERECGWQTEMIDTPATNMNGLAAARALREQLGSSVAIWDLDLDSQFRLPSERYGLIFLLGILYHLQNPFYVLHQLALHSRYLILSTRVARVAGPGATSIAELPVGYLVGPTETNNDATNYWMFSPQGLERLVERAGWIVLEQTSFGDLEASDPASPDHDERQFMLLRSRHVDPPPPGSEVPQSTAEPPIIAGRSRLRARLGRARRRLDGRDRQAPDAESEPIPSAPEPAPIPEPEAPPLLCWPLDHFYSPVPDNRALAREPTRSRVWPATPRETPGIDWRPEEQSALLQELAAQSPIVFPDGPTGNPHEYHAGSEMFSRLDAWMLQGVLRHFRPARMVEVGCGWSSLVTARINREYLDGALQFTCVEPYPPEFLAGGVDGISELIVSRVEDMPLDPFLALGAGDVLFIDTSHTVKTGGDVVFLFEEVVPRLAEGVVVHVHDIALPFDYPEDWVFSGRAWNELYLVHAFLAFNSAFRIRLAVNWLRYRRAEQLASILPNYPAAYPDGGGSLWIQRTVPGS